MGGAISPKMPAITLYCANPPMISNGIVSRFWIALGALAVSLPLLVAAAEKPIRGDPPEFPSEANRAGFDEGRLKVRLSVEPGGEVNRVEVIGATPGASSTGPRCGRFPSGASPRPALRACSRSTSITNVSPAP